jgi:hypothetical protein
MSDCGCLGKYHWGGCADQNAIFWQGVEYGRIPVNPTKAEIDEQIARNVAHRPLLMEAVLKLQANCRTEITSRDDGK